MLIIGGCERTKKEFTELPGEAERMNGVATDVMMDTHTYCGNVN